MAELTAKLVRDYFEGSWSCQVFINGELNHELEFNWTEDSKQYSVPHVTVDWRILADKGNNEYKNNHIIAVWRSDKRSWVNMWYNKSGGYSELKWTSHEEVNGITVLYGSLRERTTESEPPTEHIAMCELNNHNSFKYTIMSYRKGILEMVAKRTGSVREINVIQAKRDETVKFHIESDTL